MNKLNADSIRCLLPQATLQSLAELSTFSEIGSTNSYLLQRPEPSPGMMSVAIAEQQTSGRGRRGRRWYSPSRSGLWMSLAYTFDSRPANMSALTLAIGASLADELVILGVSETGLKWPNDLMVGDRKLGGILLESSSGGMTAVAGIGINTALPQDANDHIEAGIEPIDLSSILTDPPSIDHLAARIIERLQATLHQFDRDGFKSFVAGWSRFDTLAGLEIVVRSGDVEQTGTAQGITDDGALILKGKHGIERIVSGSVRIVDCREAVV